MDHRRLFAFSCPIGVIECDEAPVAVAVACETLYKEGVIVSGKKGGFQTMLFTYCD